MNRLLFRVSVFAAALLAVGVAVMIFADALLTRAINEFSRRALTVEARVEGCRVSLFRGTMTLEGIEIKNPAGFRSPRMLYLERVTLALAPSSLLKDPLHVRSAKISGVELTYEAAGFGRSNLSVFMEGLKGAEGREGVPVGRSANEKGRQVVIDHLLLEGGRVSLSAVTSRGRGIIINLPPMEIRDIGKDRPTTVSEAVSEVLRRLGRAALSTAGSYSACVASVF
jgi:uncharacterized protein involved in outer membrane biogenesis